MLQCVAAYVAVCCSVCSSVNVHQSLNHQMVSTVVCRSVHVIVRADTASSSGVAVLQCVAVCCSVLQCVAVCCGCSVCYSEQVHQIVHHRMVIIVCACEPLVCCSVVQCVVVWYSVCCSVVQCVL